MQILRHLPQLTMTAGTETTVEAGKDIDGKYQLWIPSDVTTVDLEAIASTLLAEVQIDDNTSSLHNNVYKNFTITGKNTINVMIKSSLNTTAEYKININRLNLDLEAVQAGPYSGGNLSNALWDSTRNAYVVRLDPQTDDLPSAIASVLAKDANNYIRIGHLTRPEKPTQGSMTDEQYAAALAQYEKEVAHMKQPQQTTMQQPMQVCMGWRMASDKQPVL